MPRKVHSILGDSIKGARSQQCFCPSHFQIFPDDQYFHLRHRGVAQQSLTPHWGHRLRLKKEPKVSEPLFAVS